MTVRRDIDKVLADGAKLPRPDQQAAVLPSNSFPASIDAKDARNELRPAWRPIPLSEISDQQSVRWAWYGFLAYGHTTLFTGLWKAGKTTLLAYVLRCFESGGDLAGEIEPSRVLVVSEESLALWARRRDQIGIEDNVAVICRPFKVKPRIAEWMDFIGHLNGLIESNGYRVVVFDTLPSHWPVYYENDASGVMSALTVLNALTEVGAAILLEHSLFLCIGLCR